MDPAKEELAQAIDATSFSDPICPVYQNTTAMGVTDSVEIQKNLIAQLTAPVRWTQSIQAMIDQGVSEFMELGPGKVLQGLVKKISPEVMVSKMEF